MHKTKLLTYNDIGQCSKAELKALVQAVNSPECYQYKTTYHAKFDDDDHREEKAILAAGFNTVIELSAFRTFKQAKDVHSRLELNYTNHKKQFSIIEEKIYITYKKYINAKNILNNTFDISDDDTICIATYFADKKGNSLYDNLHKDFTQYKNILISLINEKKRLDSITGNLYNSIIEQSKYLDVLQTYWYQYLLEYDN